MTVSKKGKYDRAAEALDKWLKERSENNWKAFCFELYNQIESMFRYNKFADNIDPSELAGEVIEKLLEDFAIGSHNVSIDPEILPKKVGKKTGVRITKDFFLANYASGFECHQSVAFILNQANFLAIGFKKKKDKGPKKSIKTCARNALKKLLERGIIFEKVCKPQKSTNVFWASFFKNNPNFHDEDTLVKPSEKISPEIKIWFKSNYVPYAKPKKTRLFLEDFFLRLFEFLGKYEKFFNQDLGDYVYELMDRPTIKDVPLVEDSRQGATIKGHNEDRDDEFFSLLRIAPDEKTMQEARRKLSAFLRLKPKLAQLRSFLVHNCLVYPEELLVELGVPPAFIKRLRDLKVGTHKSSKSESPIQSQKIGIFLNIQKTKAFTQVTAIFKALEIFQKELELRKINQLMSKKAFLKVLIAEFKNLGFFS